MSELCANCKTATTCLEMGCGQGRRAAPAAAQLDAELPPPDVCEHSAFSEPNAYSRAKVEQIVAPYAERIRLLTEELENWKKSSGLLAASRDRWKESARTAGTAPATLDDLTESERAFVELVKASPGRKLGHREAFDSEDHPLWSKPEALGLIECVGSYKWRAAAPSPQENTNEN